jgi:hypothetical protein
MRSRFGLGMLLVFVAWVPIIIWQSSVEWAPKLLGEARYDAIMATYAVQVVAIVSTAGMFLTGMYFLLRPVFDIFRGMSARAKLRATGLPGRAKVLSLGGPSGGGTVTINDQPLLSLTLEVEDGFGDPYVVAFETVVPRYAVPRVQPGETVPVKIDPNDRQRVAVDWGSMGYG